MHTVTIVSPVDALIGTNPDGSAYLEVSNLEKIFRTRWTVRVTLHPGRAYLDEQIRIFNPTDAVNPYYFWNCTAFPCRAGTRFIYPMTLGTDHNGVRVLQLAGPRGPGPVLAEELPGGRRRSSPWTASFDFFGAYDVDADRGIVQVANHYELSGKKAWTWGTWEFGQVCQKNLTDDDGPYIEVQSGPLPTQSDYGMLRAATAGRVAGMVVSGPRAGRRLRVRHEGPGRADDSRKRRSAVAAAGDRPVPRRVLLRCTRRRARRLVTKKLDLSPKAPQIVTLSPDPKAPVDVTVKTAKGEILAAFTTPLPIPKKDPPHRPDFMNKPDGQLTIEEKFLQAQKHDLAHQSQEGPRVLREGPGGRRRLCSGAAGSGRARYRGRAVRGGHRAAAEGGSAGPRRRRRLVLPGRELPPDAQAERGAALCP